MDTVLAGMARDLECRPDSSLGQLSWIKLHAVCTNAGMVHLTGVSLLAYSSKGLASFLNTWAPLLADLARPAQKQEQQNGATTSSQRFSQHSLSCAIQKATVQLGYSTDLQHTRVEADSCHDIPVSTRGRQPSGAAR
eukprot:328127-Pelagomonas_calceolata.AAC.3